MFRSSMLGLAAFATTALLLYVDAAAVAIA